MPHHAANSVKQKDTTTPKMFHMVGSINDRWGNQIDIKYDHETNLYHIVKSEDAYGSTQRRFARYTDKIETYCGGKSILTKRERMKVINLISDNEELPLNIRKETNDDD